MGTASGLMPETREHADRMRARRNDVLVVCLLKGLNIGAILGITAGVAFSVLAAFGLIDPPVFPSLAKHGIVVSTLVWAVSGGACGMLFCGALGILLTPFRHYRPRTAD